MNVNSDRSVDAHPRGWKVATMGDVTVDSRSTLDPRDYPTEVFDYFSIPAYQDGQKPIPEVGSQIRSLKLVVQPGTVLFGKLNPRVPKVWLVKDGGDRRRVASTEFIPLVSTDQVDPEFLYYLARSEWVLPKSQELVSGSTPSRQRVDLSAFMRLEVPVPPVPEQRAIAHALRGVERAKEATEQSIAAARELKLSLVSEHVTREELPATWSIKTIGDVTSRVEYGISKRGGQAGSYPILRMNSISDGRVVTNDLQWVELADNEFRRFKLERGDVLFNRTNSVDKVGKSAYFDLDGEWVFASYLLRVSVDEAVLDSRFLNYFLGAPSTQATLKGLATRAVSQANINATKLKNLAIPLPPLAEQHKIADALQAVDAKIAAEEVRKEALAVLFDAILHNLMTARLRVSDLEVLV